MASLRDAARSVLSEARDGIAWIAVYKIGKSWHTEPFWLEPENDDGKFNPEIEEPCNVEKLKEILSLDNNAILVNGYYTNLGAEYMTLQELMNGFKWHYNDHNFLLSDMLSEAENCPCEHISDKQASDTTDTNKTPENTENGLLEQLMTVLLTMPMSEYVSICNVYLAKMGDKRRIYNMGYLNTALTELGYTTEAIERLRLSVVYLDKNYFTVNDHDPAGGFCGRYDLFCPVMPNNLLQHILKTKDDLASPKIQCIFSDRQQGTEQAEQKDSKFATLKKLEQYILFCDDIRNHKHFVGTSISGLSRYFTLTVRMAEDENVDIEIYNNQYYIQYSRWVEDIGWHTSEITGIQFADTQKVIDVIEMALDRKSVDDIRAWLNSNTDTQL